jgi:hypothetical protein
MGKAGRKRFNNIGSCAREQAPVSGAHFHASFTQFGRGERGKAEFVAGYWHRFADTRFGRGDARVLLGLTWLATICDTVSDKCPLIGLVRQISPHPFFFFFLSILL